MLHVGEVAVDEALVRSLLRVQLPELADLPIESIGGGTDNTVFRVGSAHSARFPRTAAKVAPLLKELKWLPLLAPSLSLEIPHPVFEGAPTDAYIFPWAVHTWMDGEEISAATIQDWPQFGRDLACFTRELHRTDLMGATRSGDLSWYRGGGLRPHVDWPGPDFTGAVRQVPDLDTGPLEALWSDALAMPDPDAAHVWLHADLKPTNLLASNGRLRAAIDFGALSVGFPDAEHAVIWDYPPAARAAYRQELQLDEPTWTRARAWALALGVNGIAEYWLRLPELGTESLRRVRAISTSLSDD